MNQASHSQNSAKPELHPWAEPGGLMSRTVHGVVLDTPPRRLVVSRRDGLTRAGCRTAYRFLRNKLRQNNQLQNL